MAIELLLGDSISQCKQSRQNVVSSLADPLGWQHKSISSVRQLHRIRVFHSQTFGEIVTGTGHRVWKYIHISYELELRKLLHNIC